MIARPRLEHDLRRTHRASPVVANVGPRQCGKPTLARRIAQDQAADFFDPEDPVDLARRAILPADAQGRGAVDPRPCDGIALIPALDPTSPTTLCSTPCSRTLTPGASSPEEDASPHRTRAACRRSRQSGDSLGLRARLAPCGAERMPRRHAHVLCRPP